VSGAVVDRTAREWREARPEDRAGVDEVAILHDVIFQRSLRFHQ